MLKPRKTKPRIIRAVKSYGYGDLDAVFREVSLNDAFLSISNSGMGAESDRTDPGTPTRQLGKVEGRAVFNGSRDVL